MVARSRDPAYWMSHNPSFMDKEIRIDSQERDLMKNSSEVGFGQPLGCPNGCGLRPSDQPSLASGALRRAQVESLRCPSPFFRQREGL